jgi:hypothetical protein
MQKIMQNNAAVFRTQESLAEGCQLIDECVDTFQVGCVCVGGCGGGAGAVCVWGGGVVGGGGAPARRTHGHG